MITTNASVLPIRQTRSQSRNKHTSEPYQREDLATVKVPCLENSSNEPGQAKNSLTHITDDIIGKTSPTTHNLITRLPSTLTTRNTGLSKTDLAVLLAKQKWLGDHGADLEESAAAVSGQKKSRLKPGTAKTAGSRQQYQHQHRHQRISRQVRNAIASTLIFAQEEGGTAVCVSATGLLLTCAHCVAQSREELDGGRHRRKGQKGTGSGGGGNRIKWLLFPDGRAVKAECFEWDERLDLAAMRILGIQALEEEREMKMEEDVARVVVEASASKKERVVIDLTGSDHDDNGAAAGTALQGGRPILPLTPPPAGASAADLPPQEQPTKPEKNFPPSFPFLLLSRTAPLVNSPLICIGQPGPLDLESIDQDTPTNYDILHVSTGRFRGYDAHQDIYDNSEIGALMHDCWTYWGHSGAPLVAVWDQIVVKEQDRGEDDNDHEGRIGERELLIGLHSSWDDETLMRRGVGWEALKGFVERVRGLERRG